METATTAQIDYIHKLIADRGLNSDEVQKIVEHVGQLSLDALNIAQASEMIDVLKDSWIRVLRPEEFEGWDPDTRPKLTDEELEEMFASEEPVERKEKPVNKAALESLKLKLENGVSCDNAKSILREYVDAGASIKLFWTREKPTYIVKLMVSWPDELEKFGELGTVFGNLDLDYISAFDDGRNGDNAEEVEPFERCENELLERFGLTREDLDGIEEKF